MCCALAAVAQASHRTCFPVDIDVAATAVRGAAAIGKITFEWVVSRIFIGQRTITICEILVASKMSYVKRDKILATLQYAAMFSGA
jgi:hypothetical protein